MSGINIWKGRVSGYKLLDSGKGEKLEEIARQKIKRKEPRAWWQKSLAEEAWKDSDQNIDTILELDNLGLKCKVRFKQNSKHIGIFPEQASEWLFIKEKIKEGTKILNLFGYTGLATLAAAKAGGKVTHVDASKDSVEWARENQKLSGLDDAPIRWIVDDALKFLKREIKRGEKYDAIIMDPPSYGRGPKGEVWKIEEELPKLLDACRELLSDEPLFVILNMYSTELSSISVGNLLSDMTIGLGGSIQTGELVIPQENSGKLLPMSIFAIWEK